MPFCAERQPPPIDGAVTFDEVAALVYALLEHQRQHELFLRDMERVIVPGYTTPGDLSHYNRYTATDYHDV